MDATELDIHRRNTAAFIAERPSVIKLKRVDRRRTQAGGYKDYAYSERPEQTFRIIEQSKMSNPPIFNTSDGQQREIVFWLLGTFDSLMEVGEFWEDGVRVWTVEDVIRNNDYEVRGLVSERGK